MKQENRRGKALSVVMSATLAATFGVPALAVADEAVSTPAAIEQSVASDGVQQGALAAAPTEQKALQAQAEGQGAIKVGETSYPTLQEAVDAVSAGTASGKIVTLTGNVSGNGVVVKSGTDFTLDLGGFTYRWMEALSDRREPKRMGSSFSRIATSRSGTGLSSLIKL